MASTVAIESAGYLAPAGTRMSGIEATQAMSRGGWRMDLVKGCVKTPRGTAAQIISPKHASLLVSVVTDVPTPTGVPPSPERRT